MSQVARREQPQNRSSGLLHNMSCRPTTQIQHTAPAKRTYGRGIVYQLPDGVRTTTASGLLTWIDGSRCNMSEEQAQVELRTRIERTVMDLPLPPAAVVSDQARENDRLCQDPLSVVTVLAKSSARVYLRGKEPSLLAVRPGRRVVVVVPDRTAQENQP